MRGRGLLGHPVGVREQRAGRQLVPPTANLERLDPEIDLDVVAGMPRSVRMSAALSNSFGFGGQNAVLVLRTA